jgi:S-formylglutathione hydrolase FrmB
MTRSEHELHGHLEFEDIGIFLADYTSAGSFSGWFDFDEDGTVTEIWLRAFNHGQLVFVHYTWRDIDNRNEYLPRRLAEGIMAEAEMEIAAAAAERWPTPPDPEDGPTHAERL